MLVSVAERKAGAERLDFDVFGGISTAWSGVQNRFMDFT
jgi:hypothetical protein